MTIDSFALFSRESEPITTTLFANDVGMGKTFTMALVIRMYHRKLLGKKTKGREVSAYPTLWACPAGLVLQTYRELKDAFPELNIKVVFSNPWAVGRTRSAPTTR
jgi:hypothetical protein